MGEGPGLPMQQLVIISPSFWPLVASKYSRVNFLLYSLPEGCVSSYTSYLTRTFEQSGVYIAVK